MRCPKEGGFETKQAFHPQLSASLEAEPKQAVRRVLKDLENLMEVYDIKGPPLSRTEVIDALLIVKQHYGV